MDDTTQDPQRDAGLDNPMLRETGAMHAQALKEIKARGESPASILRAFDEMDARLRAKHLPSAPPAEPEPPCVWTSDESARGIERAIYFEELVAAGAPTPGQASEGRAATMADLTGGVSLVGKLLVRVSGNSMAGTLPDGCIVAVDPKAKAKDGDIVVAHVAGHGQVVKRLRIDHMRQPTLESDNPAFRPIAINDASDLRIHGKVVWFCGQPS